MEAIIIQYRDNLGSVCITQLTKDNVLKVIFTIETMTSSFT